MAEIYKESEEFLLKGHSDATLTNDKKFLACNLSDLEQLTIEVESVKTLILKHYSKKITHIQEDA